MSKISTTPVRHNLASEDIMHILRGEFGVQGCIPTEDGKSVIKVCDYHLSRCNCTIVGITDGGGASSAPLSEKINQAPCKITPQIRSLFEKMEGNFRVAGGWYLVQQQREWLQAHVENIMKDRIGKPLNILVAGVAGYAHFFSYMKVLFDAARNTGFSCSDIYVDVLDRCKTPLLEIDSFYDQVKQQRRVLPYRAGFGPLRIHFNLTNWLFIRRMHEELNQCSIEPLCKSFLEEAPEELHGKYHLVTEHFLTSMVEKKLDDIEKIRQFYASVVATGGHLLVASGFPNIDFYENFLEIHKQAGFKVVKGSETRVWDPFGLSREHIHLLLNLPKEHLDKAFVPLENAMCEFVKTPPRRR